MKKSLIEFCDGCKVPLKRKNPPDPQVIPRCAMCAAQDIRTAGSGDKKK